MDWTTFLIVDALLLVLASGVLITFFLRDLWRR